MNVTLLRRPRATVNTFDEEESDEEHCRPSSSRLAYLFLIMILAGCTRAEPMNEPATWRLVYQHDYDGRPIFGTVDDLVNAIKRGSPIRLSWGGTVSGDTNWIHFAEPVFTAVMSDTAVVVQVPLSFTQTDYVDAGNAFLQTDPPTGWRALMSTTGNYHQFHYDLSSGAVTRVMRSRTQMSWFALLPARDHRPIADLTPVDAFRLDSLYTP